MNCNEQRNHPSKQQTVPTGHGMQKCVPAAFWYRPAGQSWQADVPFCSLTLPAAQGGHTDWPGLGLAVPACKTSTLSAKNARPICRVKRTLQFVQAETPARSSLYLPRGQGVHTAVPFEATQEGAAQ